jgi:hypothetical protein
VQYPANSLLQFLLRGADPAKYGTSRSEVSVTEREESDAHVRTAEDRERLRRRLMQRLGAAQAVPGETVDPDNDVD